MLSSRKTLRSLSRSRLLGMARALENSGLAGKTKNAIVGKLARPYSVDLTELLGLLSRNELKAVCRQVGVDDGGWEKKILVERLLSCRGRSLW